MVTKTFGDKIMSTFCKYIYICNNVSFLIFDMLVLILTITDDVTHSDEHGMYTTNNHTVSTYKYLSKF